MRFVPRQPREGINVSDTHPLAEAGTLILGLSLIFAAIAVALIFAVELMLIFISTESEAKLFATWTPDDLIAIVADDERLIETRALTARLAQHWPNSPYTFRLEVNESDVPNAMAFPGGLIVVTTALLDRVETENELAFVLGHELGHFHNRDHMRMLGRTVVLGILFAALSGSEASGDFGIGVADLTLLGFSRNQELRADNFGLELVFAEYGHVNESWRFLDRISTDQGAVAELATYISTHPATGARVEDLKSRARANGWPLTGPVLNLSWRQTSQSP